MEILQEKDSKYIQEQIQLFENEINNNNYGHNNDNHHHHHHQYNYHQEMKNNEMMITNHVPCPLCHHGNLIKDSIHGMIYCQFYSNLTNSMSTSSCKLCLNPIMNTNIRGLSLDMLKHKLCQVYQEHSSTSCLGVLCFDVLDDRGQLVVGCINCGARDVVV